MKGEGIAHQSGSIGAINAEDGYGGLDLAGSGGGKGSDGSGAEGKGTLGSGSPDGAEDLSREHDGGWRERESVRVCGGDGKVSRGVRF